MLVSERLQITLSKQLRDKTGLSISEYARHHKVSRKCIYDAVNGDGVRRIRVAIARSIELPPSMLWPHNNAETRMIDDLHYLGLSGQTTVANPRR